MSHKYKDSYIGYSDISGTADFVFNGKTSVCKVEIDLDRNVLKVYTECNKNDFDLIVDGNISLRSVPVSLKNVCLISKTGYIKSDSISDVFISVFGGGTHSIYDSIINRAVSLRPKDIGVRHIEMTPKKSILEFDFIPFQETDKCFEYFFIGYNGSLHYECDLFDGINHFSMIGDQDGVLVKSDGKLNDSLDVIQSTLGLLQGSPVTFRSSLEDGKLKINFANHYEKSLGRLYKSYKDAPALANVIFQYLLKLDNSTFEKTKRGIYFFLQGLAGRGFLETKTVSLFIFLEMIDGSRVLSKESISKTLGISIHDGEFIYKIRCALIHNGDSLQDSIINTSLFLKSVSPGFCLGEFAVFDDDLQKTTRFFYFKLAMLLNRYWIRESGYSGDWNDYSVFLE